MFCSILIAFGSLRLGMQIWIDLPWYKHPFPKNRFKIATLKQLQTIRSLKLSCLFYHPTLSDPESTLVPDAPSFPRLSGLHALIEDQEVPLQPAESKPPATPPSCITACQHAVRTNLAAQLRSAQTNRRWPDRWSVRSQAHRFSSVNIVSRHPFDSNASPSRERNSKCISATPSTVRNSFLKFMLVAEVEPQAPTP